MGKYIFEFNFSQNAFFYGEKYFGGWGKVISQNQKATPPLATKLGSRRGWSLFDFGNLPSPSRKIIFWLWEKPFSKINFPKMDFSMAENILVAGEK